MAITKDATKPVHPRGNVPNMYVARLFTADQKLDLVTNLPARFPIGLATGWDTPFNQPLSDLAGQSVGGRTGQFIQAAGTLGRVIGQTTQHKWMSGAVWNNGSCITISEIPFVLIAYKDPIEEVLKPFQTLLKMVAPEENAYGLLQSPGPHLLNEKDLTSLGGDNITLQIGNFFTMNPCIIESVNGDFDTQFDQRGTPISMTMSVTVKSFWSVSKQDVDKFFTTV
jgi:hypothetical protein